MKYLLIQKVVKSPFRKRRFGFFVYHFNLQKSTKILDLGGIEETWIGTGFEDNVTLVNLNNNGDSKIKTIIGDARNLSMFRDNSFDIIFSNSVIEHVGDYKEQKKMANEIIRVSKNYWIQTPNKNFPIEIHFMFPFFSFLPKNMQKVIARFWPFSLAKLFKLNPLDELKNLHLLNKTQLRSLFPHSVILSERYLFFDKSLIALKND